VELSLNLVSAGRRTKGKAKEDQRRKGEPSAALCRRRSPILAGETPAVGQSPRCRRRCAASAVQSKGRRRGRRKWPRVSGCGKPATDFDLPRRALDRPSRWTARSNRSSTGQFEPSQVLEMGRNWPVREEKLGCFGSLVISLWTASPSGHVQVGCRPFCAIS
jgi:hypothetical protein